MTSFDETSSVDESLSVVVAPPDSFLGDDSSTPTPMLDNESLDSGKSTPRILESPSTEVIMGKSSPLVVTQYRSSDDQTHRTDDDSHEDGCGDRQVDLDCRQTVSPLAKSSYSSGREHAVSASQSKGLSILPSSQHDSQPAGSPEDEAIVSYKLSRESTVSSLDSQSSLPSSTGHEGSNL